MDVKSIMIYFTDGSSINTENQMEIARLSDALQESKRRVVQFVELPISRYSVNLQNVSYIKFM